MVIRPINKGVIAQDLKCWSKALLYYVKFSISAQTCSLMKIYLKSMAEEKFAPVYIGTTCRHDLNVTVSSTTSFSGTFLKCNCEGKLPPTHWEELHILHLIVHFT